MLPQASDRRPITIQNFAQDILPAFLCYYATAVLVIVPNTFRIRLALLPITLWAVFRAGTQVNLVAGYEQEKRLAWVNQEVTVGRFLVDLHLNLLTGLLDHHEFYRHARLLLDISKATLQARTYANEKVQQRSSERWPVSP